MLLALWTQYPVTVGLRNRIPQSPATLRPCRMTCLIAGGKAVSWLWDFLLAPMGGAGKPHLICLADQWAGPAISLVVVPAQPLQGDAQHDLA